MRISTEFDGTRDARGWKFRLVRVGDPIEAKGDGLPSKWAIYSRTRGDEVHYEVVRLRLHAIDKRVNGRLVAKGGTEYYPGASKWGIDGFSYLTREAANAKFDELNA